MSAFRTTFTAMVGALALAAFVSPAAASGVNKAAAAKLMSYANAHATACLGCHEISHTKVGPAWYDVAKRYHNNPKAVEILAKNIANGSTGLWKGLQMDSMPPGMASDAQAKKLAKMILALDSK